MVGQIAPSERRGLKALGGTPGCGRQSPGSSSSGPFVPVTARRKSPSGPSKRPFTEESHTGFRQSYDSSGDSRIAKR